jgi:hypothetical protein
MHAHWLERCLQLCRSHASSLATVMHAPWVERYMQLTWSDACSICGVRGCACNYASVVRGSRGWHSLRSGGASMSAAPVPDLTCSPDAYFPHAYFPGRVTCTCTRLHETRTP